MNFEDLVPPVELCKLIPAGEFEDSVFIWDNSEQYGFWDGEDKNGNHIGGWGKLPAMGWRVRKNFSERCRKRMKETGAKVDCYPAPTLQEIMAELSACNCYRLSEDWTVALMRNNEPTAVKSTNPATAALKLWLKLKGIENEK